MVTDAARKLVPVNLVGDVLNLGLGPRALTSQATSIAGSLSPVGVPGLGGMAPELAVVSLAASAGMRIKNGEPVADVKQWLIGELSQHRRRQRRLRRRPAPQRPRRPAPPCRPRRQVDPGSGRDVHPGDGGDPRGKGSRVPLEPTAS